MNTPTTQKKSNGSEARPHSEVLQELKDQKRCMQGVRGDSYITFPDSNGEIQEIYVPFERTWEASEIARKGEWQELEKRGFEKWSKPQQMLVEVGNLLTTK